MKEIIKVYNNTEFKLTLLSPTALSVLCLQPNLDDEGIDQSDWATAEDMAGWAFELFGEEVALSAVSAGDHTEYPEVIYTVTTLQCRKVQ